MSKVISDPLYGYIHVDALAMSIIDTPEFCRLRDLKQLGFVHYVFPSAVHNRFVHSLQTYHLARKWCELLGVADKYKMPIRIAALIHDIGHVVGCHGFDKVFESRLGTHEVRGENLFRHMCSKYNLNISATDLDLICAIAKGTPLDQHPPYVFQIVANHFNEFDVDKVYLRMDAYVIGLDHGLQEDRIMHNSRIIDNEICFDEKVYYSVYDFYHRRWREFREVLKHHACISADQVLTQILHCLDEIYDFDALFARDDFAWTCLTDSVIESCHALSSTSIDNKNKYAKLCQLSHTLAMRSWNKLYPYQDDRSDVNTVVALSGAKFHPMSRIWFYRQDDVNRKYRITHDSSVSVIGMSDTYSEIISWRYK